MPSEFEEYLRFKEFQKANKPKKKKKSKKGTKRSAESSIFKGVTDPERIDALDYYQEARNIEKKDALKGLYGAEKRARSRAFNNATKEGINYIKTADINDIVSMKFKYKPKAKSERRKNTAGAWDIPNNPAFYPEDWEKVKSGSKWAGETTIKGASAFGRGAKNVGKSAFATGKDIFSFARENKDYFSQDKRYDRGREKQKKERDKWAEKMKRDQDRAERRSESQTWKQEKIKMDADRIKTQQRAKTEFEAEKAKFYEDEIANQAQRDKDKRAEDFRFKREQVKTRQAKREFDQNNPRKWYKGFRR